MKKRILGVLTVVAISASSLLAQGQGMNKGVSNHQMAKKGARKMRAVFLIPYGLPHYSQILMNMWDDSKLALTKEQKSKLEPIRNRTMAEIQKLAPQVKALTKEIRKGAHSNASLDSLNSKVDKLATIKAKATKVQLQCIQDTKKVLTPEQIKYIYQKLKERRQSRKHQRGATK